MWSLGHVARSSVPASSLPHFYVSTPIASSLSWSPIVLLGPADSLVLFFRHHHHRLPPRQADEARARAFTSARPPFPHDASDAWDRDRQAPALAPLYSPQPIAHHPLRAPLFSTKPVGPQPVSFRTKPSPGAFPRCPNNCYARIPSNQLVRLSWTGHELAISVCKDQRFIYCVHLSGRFAPQPGQPIFAQPIFASAIAPARAHHPRRFQCLGLRPPSACRRFLSRRIPWVRAFSCQVR